MLQSPTSLLSILDSFKPRYRGAKGQDRLAKTQSGKIGHSLVGLVDILSTEKEDDIPLIGRTIVQ